MGAGATPRRALVLFTRDLRVHDQPALACAARESAEIVPAFVFDRGLLAGSAGSPNRLAFLLDSLHDLDRSLRRRGGQLVVRHGEPVEEAMRLAHEHELRTIHIAADVTPRARRRERALAAACERARIELRTHAAVTVIPAGAITPSGGDHYRVFTPYWRAWSELPRRPLESPPGRIRLPPGVAPGRIPSLASLNRAGRSPLLQAGGEGQARRRLASWSRSAPRTQSGSLADSAGSRLSAHLHFGCISAGTLLERSLTHPDAEMLARQLCWRDFHHQVLAARPDMTRRDYRPRGRAWSRDGGRAAAWREGRTGYPIVDAAMRALAEEGFIDNRARLIVSSFLTKTLRLDWRIGAAHFACLLSDADVANNIGNWQWVAGTGNDTRPNRVLNPIRQARRFDPDGEYVRSHLPELAGLDGASVHEPWRLPPGRRPHDYPTRIVDHEAAKASGGPGG